MKKIVALLLCLTLFLSGCGLQSETEEVLPEETVTEAETETAKAETDDTLVLPYDPEDVLNPYTCTGEMNYRLSGLLYEPLVELTGDYEPEYVLAESVEMTDSLTCLVTLRQDACFWNGDKLDSRDVAVSLNAARTSGNYASSLGIISAVTATDDYTLIIELYYPDPYFVNLLTVPIVEYGTQTEDTPVGSGLFMVGTEDTFVRSAYNHPGEGSIKEIHLSAVSDYKTLLYKVSTGEIDLAVADVQTGDLNFNGAATTIKSDRLLYLGVNEYSGAVPYELREALYNVLDRETILQECYESCGCATCSPLNPEFPGYESGEAPESDPEALKTYLEGIGYTLNAEGLYVNSQEEPFTLTLLVNNDNSAKLLAAEEICRQLQELGVQAEVYGLPYSKYLTALSNGNYDLYLGEVRLPADMNLAYLFSSVYGAGTENASYNWNQVLYGNLSAEKFDEAFREELPFIPLLYHDSVLIYSRRIYGVSQDSVFNPFRNILEWTLYKVD